MHNRKVASSKSSTSLLPLYSSSGSNGTNVVISPNPMDLINNKSSRLQLHYRFRPTAKQLQNLYKSLVITITVCILFTYILNELPIQDEEDDEVISMLAKRRTMIQQFPSLQYPLEHSTLIGLYFAASWCPMSTPVTKQLNEVFRNVILKPPITGPVSDNTTTTTTSILQQQEQQARKNADFSIVYVSSDKDAESMNNYIQPNWFVVPFENVTERSALKRMYKTCAKRELDDLGFTRKHEIPTLVIISSELHEPLTYDGIQDVKEHGVDAIEHWFELLRLAKALNDKYPHNG